jgi:hypothetical protein
VIDESKTLTKAKEIGAKWGATRFELYAPGTAAEFPALDRMKHMVREWLGDTIPLDDHGRQLVNACYEAARSEFEGRRAKADRTHA